MSTSKMKPRDYTDEDDLSQGPGDPDLHPGKWIGVDMPEVNVVMDSTHWSDLPTPITERQEWELGDQMADHSDQQEYDEAS